VVGQSRNPPVHVNLSKLDGSKGSSARMTYPSLGDSSMSLNPSVLPKIWLSLLLITSPFQVSSEEAGPSTGLESAAYTVQQEQIDDLKAVIATVRSKKVIEARVRTPGTVATIAVTEGAYVQAGQVLGTVVDPKIALRLKASESQIVAISSRLATAKSELDRAVELAKRGVTPQARLDQAQTAFDVATNDLAAARSERDVILKQAEEGEVLAPASGRVLRVPVTDGSVVMAGESIATIAANEYLLRLEVPERYAQHLRAGDTLKVGRRGLNTDGSGITTGRIALVYPEIQAGRVIADAEVPGLGDYYVGERTLVWISAGPRKTIKIPKALTFTRFGIDYVRLRGIDGRPIEVVVQLGQPIPREDGTFDIEVLAGLAPGDQLIKS
jgi:RND family efflux transporter MFP subunit